MGVSIHGSRIAVKDIIAQVDAQITDYGILMDISDLLDKILPHFGVVDFGVFYTVRNKYYEEYCPASALDEFINRYYDIGEDFYITGMESFGYGASADDVAEKLGIELSSEEEGLGW